MNYRIRHAFDIEVANLRSTGAGIKRNFRLNAIIAMGLWIVCAAYFFYTWYPWRSIYSYESSLLTAEFHRLLYFAMMIVVSLNILVFALVIILVFYSIDLIRLFNRVLFSIFLFPQSKEFRDVYKPFLSGINKKYSRHFNVFVIGILVFAYLKVEDRATIFDQEMFDWFTQVIVGVSVMLTIFYQWMIYRQYKNGDQNFRTSMRQTLLARDYTIESLISFTFIFLAVIVYKEFFFPTFFYLYNESLHLLLEPIVVRLDILLSNSNLDIMLQENIESIRAILTEDYNAFIMNKLGEFSLDTIYILLFLFLGLNFLVHSTVKLILLGSQGFQLKKLMVYFFRVLFLTLFATSLYALSTDFSLYSLLNSWNASLLISFVLTLTLAAHDFTPIKEELPVGSKQ